MTKRKPRPLPGSPGPLRVPPRILTPQSVPVPMVRVRRWPKVVAVVLVAAALAAGAIFAATSMSSSSVVGEKTPEAAVEKFVRAANAADVLGVLDSLLPIERDAWRQPLQQYFVDGRRLRLIPNTADAKSLQGLDLNIQAAAEPAEWVAPDIAVLGVGGSVSSTVLFGGANPIGAAERGVHLRLAAVRSGTRWYVSIWHSVAENLRHRSNRALTWPSKVSAVSDGSSTPIEAASKLLSAVEQLSLGDLIAVLDPEDAAALQRVAPWFVPGTQQALDEWVLRSGLSLRLSDPQFVARSKGNNAVVTFAGLQAVVKSHRLGVAIRDNCGIFSNVGELDTRQCLGNARGTRESLSKELLHLGVEPVLIRAVLLYDDIRRALDGLTDVGIAVHNVGGLWYVNPTATVTSLLLAVLGRSDGTLGEALAEDLRTLISMFVDESPSDSSGVSGSPTGATGALGTAGTPGTVDTFGRYSECRSQEAFEAARACIDAGLLSGEISRDAVDGSFLYPECGWRGSRFDPTVPSMSNGAYMRLVTDAAACMQDKVDAGLLAPYQVPFELIRIDCLKGMNPSRMGTDTAKKYLQCQYGDE